MDEGTYRHCLAEFIRDAFSKTNGTPKAASEWMSKQMTTSKLAIFTPNPTEKTQAALTVNMHLEQMAAGPDGGRPVSPAEAQALAAKLYMGWVESGFLRALAFAKAAASNRGAAKQYMKEATKRLDQLKSLGSPNIEYYRRLLESAKSAT